MFKLFFKQMSVGQLILQINQKAPGVENRKHTSYPGNGSKNQKSNLSGTTFLHNLEMLSTRKTTNQVVLAAKFPSFY